MSVYLGSTKYTNVYLGTTKINKIYYGTNLVYSPAVAYCDETLALLSRMDATAESRPSTFDDALDVLIRGLITDNIYDTQFDVLVNLRGGIGIGPLTSKLNYIQNNYNALAVNSPTYTEGDGYNSNGTTSYINTQYNPSTVGGLYGLNDSCWGYLTSGDMGSGVKLNGSFGASGRVYFGAYTGNAMNNASEVGGRAYLGYNCMTRDNSSTYKIITDGVGVTTITSDSSNLPETNICQLACYRYDSGGYPAFFSASTEKQRLYWIGKSITESDYAKLKSRFNTFYSSVC